MRTIYVCDDKPSAAKDKDHIMGLPLSISSDFALYSCIAEASAAQPTMIKVLNQIILKRILLYGLTQ